MIVLLFCFLIISIAFGVGKAIRDAESVSNLCRLGWLLAVNVIQIIWEGLEKARIYESLYSRC